MSQLIMLLLCLVVCLWVVCVFDPARKAQNCREKAKCEHENRVQQQYNNA